MLALPAALLASVVRAQTPAAQPPTNPSWADAVEAAWQRSPDNPQGSGQLRRAEAESTAAHSLWAAPPALELEHRSGRARPDGRMTESEVGVVWPLWMPGQRAARADAADAAVQAARASLLASRWRVAGDVREAAVDVTAQQTEVRQAELQTRLMKALAEDVERRVRAGDLARADAMAARAEMLQAEAQQQDAMRRLQAALSRWTLLTGLTAVPPPTPHGNVAGQPEHPELLAAAQTVERARRQLASVERSRREPPEMGVRLRRDTDPTGSATSAGVSLRIPFATADRNAPLVAQAQAELDVAIAQEQRTRDRLALERETARLNLQGAEQQLAAERARASLLRQRAELIEKSFKAGDTSLPELLRALAAAAQADAAVVRQEAALALARARLAQSQGVSP